MVWDTDIPLLREFLVRLDSNYFNLRFTATYDQQQITFLNVTVYVQEDGSLGTTLFRIQLFMNVCQCHK